MKRIFNIYLLVVICNVLTYGQIPYLYCLNEGAYDYNTQKSIVPVSLGKYDFQTKTYINLFDIPGCRFASDLQISDGVIWIAADRFLNAYRLSDLSLISSTEIEGIRKIAFYENLIIVSRGEYLKTLDSYIQVYDKNNLTLLFQVPLSELPFTTESILIKDHYAYVAVNNGFDFGKEVGKIAKVDLLQLHLDGIIELGEQGKNPENLMWYKDQLVSLNNKNYMGSSVSLIDLKTGSVVHHALSDVESLCGTSALSGNRVLYQESGETELGSYDLNSASSGFYLDPMESFYGLQVLEQEGIILAGQTDFKTYGKVNMYDLNWNIKEQFQAGIAPAYFALVYQVSTSTSSQADAGLRIFPNPVKEQIQIRYESGIDQYTLKNLAGIELLTGVGDHLNMEGLPGGFYILSIRSGSTVISIPVCKTL